MKQKIIFLSASIPEHDSSDSSDAKFTERADICKSAITGLVRSISSYKIKLVVRAYDPIILAIIQEEYASLYGSIGLKKFLSQVEVIQEEKEDGDPLRNNFRWAHEEFYRGVFIGNHKEVADDYRWFWYRYPNAKRVLIETGRDGVTSGFVRFSLEFTYKYYPTGEGYYDLQKPNINYPNLMASLLRL